MVFFQISPIRWTQILLSSITCLAATAASLSIEASGLSQQQIKQAQTLSAGAAWPQARVSVTPHPLGLQTLSVEKQERKNQQGSRWLVVYQYHYTLQSARMLVIDMDTNTVVKQSPINTIHLPLSTHEIEFAQSLLSDDNSLIEKLRVEQIQRGEPAFSSLQELDVKASIYEPLSSSDNCFAQRCALLSLFDKTRTVFSIEPIINLTALKVRALGSQ